jgi:hypothetical protein
MHLLSALKSLLRERGQQMWRNCKTMQNGFLMALLAHGRRAAASSADENQAQ